MRRHTFRYQQTIGRPAHVRGVGYLTGALVNLTFRPAPPNTGVMFARTDLGPHAHIPARGDNVTGTSRRTTLGHAPVQVGLVEHVLAALSGLRIDNCWIDLDAPEPPGLDGSAQPFVDLLRGAGTVMQPARRPVYSVDRPVVVTQKGATLALHPGPEDELKLSYILDYGPLAPIPRQIHTQVITPQNFANDLANCRTFILETEAAELLRQGLGTKTTTADLLVFGKHGPIGNRLRYADEPARHKVLDLLGDLSLFGHDLRGHVVAYRSGHPLNVELVHALTRELAGCQPNRQQAAA